MVLPHGQVFVGPLFELLLFVVFMTYYNTTTRDTQG